MGQLRRRLKTVAVQHLEERWKRFAAFVIKRQINKRRRLPRLTARIREASLRGVFKCPARPQEGVGSTLLNVTFDVGVAPKDRRGLKTAELPFNGGVNQKRRPEGQFLRGGAGWGAKFAA